MENDTSIKYTRAIKDLSLEDRPREKALKYGIHSLSKAELLAILIGSGTKGESVIDLSQRLLKWSDNKLNILGKKTIGDLKRNFRGIGDARAISILAAIELGRLYATENIDINEIQLKDSTTAYDIMKYEIGHLNSEEFWIAVLNRANKLVGKFRISSGGIATTVVDIRLIIKTALDNFASAIILYHNHPSGNPSPSQNDDAVTKKVIEGCRYLDINVLDHIIVCEHKYYSYKDNGGI